MVPWNQLQEGSPACEVSGWVGIMATKTERITQIHFQGRRSRRRRVVGSSTAAKTSLWKWIRVFQTLSSLFHFAKKCQMYANFPGVDSLRTAFKNEKKNSSSLIYVLLKTWNEAFSRRNRAQWRQRNHVQKSLIHMQSCYFACLNLLLIVVAVVLAPAKTPCAAHFLACERQTCF